MTSDFKNGLYSPAFEHDACGVGFVADIAGNRSHKILKQALRSVINLTHRGAVDADAKTGDGAGVLTQIPGKLFRKELQKLGSHIGAPDELGVGMIFLPREDLEAQKASRSCHPRRLGLLPRRDHGMVRGERRRFCAGACEKRSIGRRDRHGT